MAQDPRPCANPLCSYVLLGSALYCCGGCADAHRGDYEIHEGGFFGHSVGCAQRTKEQADEALDVPPMAMRAGRRAVLITEILRRRAQLFERLRGA